MQSKKEEGNTINLMERLIRKVGRKLLSSLKLKYIGSCGSLSRVRILYHVVPNWASYVCYASIYIIRRSFIEHPPAVGHIRPPKPLLILDFPSPQYRPFCDRRPA